MNQYRAQAGASFYMMGLGIVVAVFFGIIIMKSVPIYLNEMKIAKAVATAAEDPALARASLVEIRNRLQRQWDIEDIRILQPKDVKLVRDKSGKRKLKYQYEAREHLFLNVSMVHAFSGEYPMVGID